MKTNLTLLCIASVLTSALTADTIELKSGVTYQGKVLSEDEKSYLIEISYSESIKDERRIPKDQIRKITSEAKDAKDFEAVKAYVPTPDMLSEKAYTKRIIRSSKFLRNYPKSKHTKEVQAINAQLQKERQLITEGGIKLNGKLISATEYKTNAYDIDAQIIAASSKRRAKNGNLQKALRKWEELEKNYSSSTAYIDSQQWVPQILKSYKNELQQNLDTFQARVDQRISMIETLEPGDKDRTQRLIDKKKAGYEALMEKEKRTLKTKWLTADSFNKRAMEHNLRSAQSTLQKIKSRRSAKKRLAGADYQGAWQTLANSDFAQTKKHIQALKSMRVPEKYLTQLNTALEQGEAASEAADAAKAAKEKAAEEAKQPKADETETTEKTTES